MESETPLRILIVEDVPADAELAERTLRKEGLAFSSSRVDTKEAFLNALETYHPDLIVSGYTMPNFDGLTALRLSLERAPDIPFIILTGSMNEETAVECMKAGAWDYVIKDRIARLPFAVREALNQKKSQKAKSTAEAALVNSEELYRSLFENMLNGFAYCRMIFEDGKPIDFIYLSVNDAFEKHTGLKDVVGRKVSEVIPGLKETDPEIFEVYGRVALTSQPERFEIFLKALRMWFSISVYSPALEYFVAVFDVITERKLAEEALQESEERYRFLFDSAIEGIFLLSTTGDLLAVNESFARMHGYSVEEMLGMNLKDLDTPDTYKLVETRMRRALAGESLTFEVEHYHKDGHIFPLEVSARLVDIHGKQFFQAFHRDITERKLAEAQLLEEKHTLSSITDSAQDPIIMIDDDGRATFWNPAAEKVFGYSKEEALGKDLHNLIVPRRFHKAFRDSFPEFRRTGRGAAIGKILELQALRRDQSEFDVELSLSAVQIQGNWRAVGVVREISARKSLEAQFRQAQKMETIGMLAGGVAHDFNNLLTVIVGHSEMALAQLSPVDPLYLDLQDIQQAADRASGLTRQLLAFSRKQILEPKVFNMNDLVKNLIKMLNRLIGEDVEVKFRPGKDLMNIKADPGQIEQVIFNLSTNARDAMREGGKLIIETQNVRLDDDFCRIHPEFVPGEYVALSVRDTGCGMSPDVLEKIFDPFFTTKEIGMGTGLGLSTVFGIVKQSGGHISVNSEVGKGSTFLIYFPTVAETVDGTAGKGKGEISLWGTETILLVEDEETVRDIAFRALKQYGYQVIVAASGGDALLLCENIKKPVDLVLTDVIMPGMTGAEFIARLRQRWPGVKALFMSGYTADSIVRQGVLDPGMSFIGKPFRLEMLVKKVREVLGSPSMPQMGNNPDRYSETMGDSA